MPVSAQIKRELGRRIGRQWTAGERLPGVQELARMLGAGQRNTHRAMRELVDEGLLVARPGMGTFVARDLDQSLLREKFDQSGPMLSGVGDALLAGKIVTVLAPRIEPGTLIYPMVQFAHDELSALGAKVSVLPFEDRGLVDLCEYQGQGLLVIAQGLRTELTFGPEQVVCMIRYGPAAGVRMPGRYDLVNADWEGGGFIAGHHIKSLGFSDVAFIGRRAISGQGVEPLSESRLRGFQWGLGRDIPASQWMLSDHYDDRSAAKLVPQFIAMSPRPLAIFAASDDLALGFMLGASSHGMEAGRDYHIIGFDGQARGRESSGPALTTIDVPFDTMSQRAVEFLSQRLLNPRQPIRKLALGCSLFRGATAKTIPSSSISSSSHRSESTENPS